MTNKLKSFMSCLLYCSLFSVISSSEGGSCASGFTSVERMSAVLGQYGKSSVEELFKDTNTQVLVPGSNFSCSGQINAWVFGARWRGQTPLLTELQIWRPSGGGVYAKVGATTITTQENRTNLYRIPLSSPLMYQAGDILGFYQGRDSRTQLMLLYENTQTGPLAFVSEQDSPAELFVVRDEEEGDDPEEEEMESFHAMIGIETDEVGCENGFMSQERMRILLGLDRVRSVVTRDQRQQITPDIHFTCGGVITGWVVGGIWNGDVYRYPEVQLWRRVNNETIAYRKINGTVLRVQSRSSNDIYEYRGFRPIPFEPGDVIGMYVPTDRLSKLRVRSEDDGVTLNYYMTLNVADKESPFYELDLDDSVYLQTQQYLPLISAYITQTQTPTYREPSTVLYTRNSISQSSEVSVQSTPLVPATEGADRRNDFLLVAIVIGVVIGSTCINAILVVGCGVIVSWRNKNKKKKDKLSDGTSNSDCTISEESGVNYETTIAIPVQGSRKDLPELSGEYRKFDNPLYNALAHHVYESVS